MRGLYDRRRQCIRALIMACLRRYPRPRDTHSICSRYTTMTIRTGVPNYGTYAKRECK